MFRVRVARGLETQKTLDMRSFNISTACKTFKTQSDAITALIKQYASLANAMVFYQNMDPFINRLSKWLSYNIEQQ